MTFNLHHVGFKQTQHPAAQAATAFSLVPFGQALDIIVPCPVQCQGTVRPRL
jgi:hypothetical protein